MTRLSQDCHLLSHIELLEDETFWSSVVQQCWNESYSLSAASGAPVPAFNKEKANSLYRPAILGLRRQKFVEIRKPHSHSSE
jgi:hypothetical protein